MPSRPGSARSCREQLQQFGPRDGAAEFREEADAVILVHNHPSGDPTPSRADIQMTQSIIEIAKPLGVVVHDQIIVGHEGHASLKGQKLI